MNTLPPDSLPVCVWDVQAQLGEGPVWIPSERAVYFVDIVGKAIHRWHEDGERRTWNAPAEPGFVFPCTEGGFLCGLRDGLYRFEPASGAFERLLTIDSANLRHRLNDGYVDAGGRLWFGTMHEDARTEGGILYSLERGPRLRAHDMGYVVTNGPAQSPDGDTLYHNDSARGIVYAFTHSAGRLSDRRPFITFPAGVHPDGMTIDADGHLWIALFNGWRVERYAADGRKVGEIQVPCANPTKPAFGGSDLRTLYITSARLGVTVEDQRQPQAGGLFAARVTVPGLPAAELSLA